MNVDNDILIVRDDDSGFHSKTARMLENRQIITSDFVSDPFAC